MVRIIMFILKCLVGLLATVGLVVSLLIGLGIYAATQGVDPRPEPELAERNVLVLALADGVSEAPAHDPLHRIGFSNTLPLQALVEALEEAAQDPRIAAVVAKLGRGALTWTQAQELRAALAVFNASGKPSFAFAESFGEGGPAMAHYYLAAAFGEIWVQPSASFPLIGFSLEQPYLKDALEDAGISAQIVRREQYKSALDIVAESGMPTPVRLNLNRLLLSRLNQFLNGVAADRQIASRQVRALVDSAPFKADDALSERLIDTLGYWDEFADQVDLATGAEANWLAPQDYLTVSRQSSEGSGARIGLIYGLGPVVLGQADGGFGSSVSMASDVLAEAFASAREDGNLSAIVFRIDSPGGSYVASDTIWREVYLAREAGIPVIVSMGGVAASGGYFVAAPANKIVANPGTVTGSIGVITGKINLEEFLADQGIAVEGPQAGLNADLLSAARPFTDEQLADLEARTEASYQDFLTKVANGRGMTVEAVRRIAGGQVWTGQDALDAGLIDALGGLTKALQVAREEAGLSATERIELIPFPDPEDPVGAFISELMGGQGLPGVSEALRGLMLVVRVLDPALSLLKTQESAGSPQLRIDGGFEKLN